MYIISSFNFVIDTFFEFYYYSYVHTYRRGYETLSFRSSKFRNYDPLTTTRVHTQFNYTANFERIMPVVVNTGSRHVTLGARFISHGCKMLRELQAGGLLQATHTWPAPAVALPQRCGPDRTRARESRRGVAKSLMQLREVWKHGRHSQFTIYSGSFACICDKFRYNPCGHSKMSE